MNDRLFVGQFYGTQAPVPSVVHGGLLYRVGNVEAMTWAGYGGPNQDGRAVLAVSDSNHFGEAEEGAPATGARFAKAPCLIVPVMQVQFKPEYRPSGVPGAPVLREWVVYDTEINAHIVVASSKEKALAIKVKEAVLRDFPPVTPLVRRKARLWWVQLAVPDRVVELYVSALDDDHLVKLLTKAYGKYSSARFWVVPDDALEPPVLEE